MIQADVKKRLGDFSLDANLSYEHFICLTGKNSSGKTALLNLITGILTLNEGGVTLNSRKVTNQTILRTEATCYLISWKFENGPIDS